MSSLSDLSSNNFAKVMDYPEDPDDFYVFDFSKGYDPDFIRSKEWGIGKYDEERSNMYVSSLFGDKRNIHMGIDIWAKAGEPVFSFYKGVVAYMQNNNHEGDYGPTVVIRYQISNATIFALYGHLSAQSLAMTNVGDEVEKGQQIATLGEPEVNGGWVPHLHFQLAVEDPGEADMPGVVAEENHEQALETYPDPRLVLGALY